MIQLNRKELRDKIYACWIGKNIGGTLGTPFEGKQQVNDCVGFSSEPGKPLPNDDLDLQLIWLKAVRENGPQKVNAKLLGEYWLEYITPFWNEYGICKGNMRFGLPAPLSGEYKNHWKHSNGAWIRTEIWATLFPADVENAIRYAYEDACVDHGAGEGTFAAIFVSAIESAAFVVSNPIRLIQIGLSKIPRDCRTYAYIQTALDCYQKNMTWLETRNLLTDMTTSDPELGWFQAPANVAYAMTGLLYGGGDFKRTLLIACNCGDDTDCTCATAGALLGIMNGTAIIPDDWKAYIGDDIVTVSLNLGAGLNGDSIQHPGCIPKSCTELTDIVCSMHAITTNLVTEDISHVDEADILGFKGNAFSLSLQAQQRYAVCYESILFHAVLEYTGSPAIAPGEKKELQLSLSNRFLSQKQVSFRWLLPEGFAVSGPKSAFVDGFHVKDYRGPAIAQFVLTAPETADAVKAKNIAVLEISCEGHPDLLYIPVILPGR